MSAQSRRGFLRALFVAPAAAALAAGATGDAVRTAKIDRINVASPDPDRWIINMIAAMERKRGARPA